MYIYTNCHLGQESLYSIPGTLLHTSQSITGCVFTSLYALPPISLYFLLQMTSLPPPSPIFSRQGGYPRLYRRIRARGVAALRCYSPPGWLATQVTCVSGATRFQYLRTYRGLRYAADGKVASAGQDCLCHDPVVRYILRTRDETASLL
jgi:hypothetical protein